jgi:23S rRNA (cytidine1920-2'-O)/16S rRNA (cytidine1409-2'-O)-methyltransferase
VAVTVRGRLDAELVRRGLARSREQAADLIAAGRVAVGGQVAAKPATQVARDAAVTVADDADAGPQYVSRGGHKLAGALAAFNGLEVTGKRCLDAGASTGGFTDVLLRAGAAHVVAADVGYGQLAWSLQTDERVTVLDRVNVRSLDPALVAPPPSVVVADLSFISLSLVLPALAACAAPDADFVLMVKPQFEVGKGRVGAGGVVRSPEDRAAAVRSVCDAAWSLGLGVRGVTASPLPGPSGNVEYFVWFRRGALPLDDDVLRQAIESGPRLLSGGSWGDDPVPPMSARAGLIAKDAIASGPNAPTKRGTASPNWLSGLKGLIVRTVSMSTARRYPRAPISAMRVNSVTRLFRPGTLLSPGRLSEAARSLELARWLELDR